MGFIFCVMLSLQCFAQSDSAAAPKKSALSRGDSLYMVKLNNSGNLMIAGGVGLTGVGGYLIYQGVKVYNSTVVPNTPTAAEDQQRNHRQGIIYMAAGGVSIAGGIILTAFGARNKIEFKHRKKQLQLETGWLPSNQMGLALTF